VIACPAGSALAARAQSSGIPVFTDVRFRKANHPGSFIRDVIALGRLARLEAFDCLHTHGSQDTWATVCARWLFGLPAPILMTRHNTKPVRSHFFNRWLYRRGIDRVVVVSGGALEQYRRFFDEGILDTERVPVIHSCVDLERFAKPPCSTRIRRELGIGVDIPLIGLIGRVSKDKGHLVLLEAAPRILKEFSDAVFIFVGHEGPILGPVVREIIRKKGLEKSVRLLGFREDILDITAALDLSVLPATGTDSSPAVLKEALLFGKPVVASRLGGIPEIITDKEGVLVAPGDARGLAQAIIAVLDDRGKRVTAATEKFPERFTPAFMCSAYLKVYEGMLNRGGRNFCSSSAGS